MIRITDQTRREQLNAALDLYPPHLRELLQFDVFMGDGLWSGVESEEIDTYGRSSRFTAHVSWGEQTFDKRTTIFLPETIGVPFMVHELAHVLDWVTGIEISTYPVTQYATTNRNESFAEFATAALVPGYLPWDPTGIEEVQWQREPLERLGLV